MRSKLFSQIRGSVQIEIRGAKVEWFLNRLLHRKLEIWDIRRTGADSMELGIHIRDFFRLRPLLKETGCRMKVIKREGLPFLLDKIEKRKWFVAGMLLFVAGLYMLASIVWHVQVEATDRIEEQTVLEAARDVGIHRFQWKYKLKNLDQLSAELTQRIPDAAWIGVKQEGVRIRIEVVESTVPDERPFVHPRDLVATHDAVVSNVIAEKGRPIVSPNMKVRKGDVLISGVIGAGDHRDLVAADGTVKGWVWYEYDLHVPLIHKRKVYTGRALTRRYVLFGDRALQIAGFGRTEFAKSESVRNVHRLQWRNFNIPFGWMKEKVMESGFIEEHLPAEAAKKMALERARTDILREAGAEAAVTDVSVLEQKTEDKQLRLKVLFEVEQNIAEERVLIMQQEPEENTD